MYFFKGFIFTGHFAYACRRIGYDVDDIQDSEFSIKLKRGLSMCAHAQSSPWLDPLLQPYGGLFIIFLFCLYIYIYTKGYTISCKC